MERQTALVVDASVVVKWFVPETDSPEALRVKDAHVSGKISLLAPDLLTYEVTNALRYRSSVSNDDLATSIKSLFELDVALIVPTSESLSRTASLARSLDLTIYDATYLELAQSLDCQIVTSDELFHKKALAGKDGKPKTIVLLKDLARGNLVP